jgi:hypothetical protein
LKTVYYVVQEHGDSQKIKETGGSYRDGCPEKILENIKERKS